MKQRTTPFRSMLRPNFSVWLMDFSLSAHNSHIVLTRGQARTTITFRLESLLCSCDVCPVLALTSDPVRKRPSHSSLTHDPRRDLTRGSLGYLLTIFSGLTHLRPAVCCFVTNWIALAETGFSGFVCGKKHRLHLDTLRSCGRV